MSGRKLKIIANFIYFYSIPQAFSGIFTHRNRKLNTFKSLHWAAVNELFAVLSYFAFTSYDNLCVKYPKNKIKQLAKMPVNEIWLD